MKSVLELTVWDAVCAFRYEGAKLGKSCTMKAKWNCAEASLLLIFEFDKHDRAGMWKDDEG